MFHIHLPKFAPQRLAIKLNVAGERSVRNGHPWIFSESIEKINKEAHSGDVAIIFSHSKNKPIGVGLYDPDSPIRLKMLHSGGGAQINSAFFADRIERAFSLRHELLETNTNSYRLLFGENDGFPGLIADVYAGVLVIKLYSTIWFPYIEQIIEHLITISNCEAVVIRLSRRLQQTESYGLKDGTIFYGNLDNETVHFIEHGVHFSAHVILGHKTGYFLDHRENRRQVGLLSKSKKVLDVFSYAGGFSVHALANGATEVTSVDISKQALELAVENGKLNEFKGVHTTLAGDAFTVLQQLIEQKKTFDVVVIDPPSFAKSKKEVDIAKKKYSQLAKLGIALTAKNGLLVLASCSSRITSEAFFAINETVLNSQHRNYNVVQKTNHDIDHPISFSEGAYLKCGYYRFIN
ncbi:class I SAM-dependent rRNA methyltransferase [Cochleicola gelatinilyticus]|uniref:SAM-dependent methyltransferase n=1 Tax=Cochleicola gelatinilyticus TaxID=1763537 RepID=A0A167GWJ8_9FLAO|nr:class I SAM-dependent rRNA methyltransferase [Cochleicola gelatinilyticus]OAB77977.1 SAM-dependent methyltransferase [Cochleicola gelatinilyticus]